MEQNERPTGEEKEHKLLELHELRNDMWMYIEKVRREKALDWLLENALR